MKRLILYLMGSCLMYSSLFASISNAYVPEIDAIIFDCDGVLVDTEYLKFLAWQEALASQNILFSLEDYIPLIGYNSEKIHLMLQEKMNRQIGKEVIQLKRAKYHDLQKQGVPSLEAMVQFVRDLALQKDELGILIGLASSAPKDEILRNLEQIGLIDVFDVIVSGADDLKQYSDPEGTNKPKPYIYLEASKRLNIDPSKCLVFEDTQVGVEAAALAGMTVIAVPNQLTLEQDFSKAVEVIPSDKLKEIQKLGFVWDQQESF